MWRPVVESPDGDFDQILDQRVAVADAEIVEQCSTFPRDLSHFRAGGGINTIVLVSEIPIARSDRNAGSFRDMDGRHRSDVRAFQKLSGGLKNTGNRNLCAQLSCIFSI